MQPPKLPPGTTLIAEDLKFPEGPIALPDGSVVLVEIARGTLSQVSPEGVVTVIADLGGGPNGAALGPDGYCYVCNNGGFQWLDYEGLMIPGEQPEDYSGGRIERVDLDSGRAEVLYSHCNEQPLRGPNDIVFDRAGNFWFTDHGKVRARDKDRTGVFYARSDGSEVREVLFPLEGPNGIGLSPDETELYVAETQTGRLWAYRLSEPGIIDAAEGDRPDGGRLLPGRDGYYLYDSLAVDAAGNICVATLIQGGISIVSPHNTEVGFVPMPDILTTNICFGGEDMQTAYVTLSSTGRLIALPWQHPGLVLNYQQR